MKSSSPPILVDFGATCVKFASSCDAVVASVPEEFAVAVPIWSFRDGEAGPEEYCADLHVAMYVAETMARHGRLTSCSIRPDPQGDVVFTISPQQMDSLLADLRRLGDLFGRWRDGDDYSFPEEAYACDYWHGAFVPACPELHDAFLLYSVLRLPRIDEGQAAEEVADHPEWAYGFFLSSFSRSLGFPVLASDTAFVIPGRVSVEYFVRNWPSCWPPVRGRELRPATFVERGPHDSMVRMETKTVGPVDLTILENARLAALLRMGPAESKVTTVKECQSTDDGKVVVLSMGWYRVFVVLV
jgi:hypothetical protein